MKRAGISNFFFLQYNYILFFNFQSIVGGLKISEMARLNKVIMEKGADHPDFCNGISYMMSLQTVKTFLEAIQKPEVRKISKLFDKKNFHFSHFHEKDPVVHELDHDSMIHFNMYMLKFQKTDNQIN